MNIFCDAADDDECKTSSEAECQLNEDALHVDILVCLMFVNSFHNVIILTWFVPACILIYENGSGQRDLALAVVQRFRKKI